MSAHSDTGTMPLRPALRPEEDSMSPKSGPVKVVSIAEPEESSLCTNTPEDPTRPRQFPASTTSRRMTGRPQIPSNASSRLSLVSTNSMEDYIPSDTTGTLHSSGTRGETEKHHRHHQHQHDKLLNQVAEWLQAEKAKRAARKSHKRSSKDCEPAVSIEEVDRSTNSRPRTSSQSSDSSSLSLDRLQRILEDNMSSFGHEYLPTTSPSSKSKRPSMQPGALSPSLPPRRLSHAPRRRSSAKKLSLSGFQSSDTEFGQDGEGVVNSCDAILDNSKTMSYVGGAIESSLEATTLRSKREEKERKAWLSFKTEILKITITLQLRRWRNIPLECGGDIEVKRLSGALTNAVYVVSPPAMIPLADPTKSYKRPAKLLLRVYGPQVEHLIDRENELGILRRLAKKKIGPRLLGTFQNGRFEQYFESTTLTAEDLRVEGTSKQIAKRMRELHDGIELLPREIQEGPFVWLNWDKWVDRCQEVICYLDKQILSGKKGREPWRERGLVCGVEWPVFKQAVDRYRKWLDDYYAVRGGVNKRLVFAHNDTQYGNILRIIPERKPGAAPSPLLLPENTHRQLIVIDFEYASANTPGLEFANHFTEWCYNYHDPSRPWACNTDRYPTLEEQRRFIRSYVNHRPQFNPRASATPKLAAMDGPKGNSISDFLLDSRNPCGLGNDYAEEERQREAEVDRQVEELLKEVKIWRVANSAMWVAWGIVQAKVPELDEKTVIPGAEKTEEPVTIEHETNGITDAMNHVDLKENKRPEGFKAEALLQDDSVKETEQPEEEEDEFDYLGYAQDRALFFWGDVVNLGIVKKEDLPRNLVESMKIVEY